MANPHQRLVVRLVLVVILMFGFGYLLVPIYNVFCEQVGINGKTGDGVDYHYDPDAVDHDRVIKVQFLSNRNASIPWDFEATTKEITLHPGEIKRVGYHVKNRSDKRMVVQAIPSVVPGYAAKYLKKTECFCFTQQALDSKDEMDMPLLFHIDKALPKRVVEVTLSYTLFDVTNMKKRKTSQTPGRIS